MKARAWLPILGLCMAIFPSCSQPARGPTVTAIGGSAAPSDVPVPTDSSNYSNVAAAAEGLVSKTGLKWGNPVKVEWQPAPLNRFVVTYATPQSELGWAGERAVFVETNWHAWFTPRE